MTTSSNINAIVNGGIFLGSASISTNTTTTVLTVDTNTIVSGIISGGDFRVEIQGVVTNGSFVPLVQKSNDGVTYTDVLDEDFNLTVVTNGTDAIVESGHEALTIVNSTIVKAGLGVKYKARYYKLSIVSTGVTSAQTINVAMVFPQQLHSDRKLS